MRPQLMRQIGGERTRKTADQGDERCAASEKFKGESRDGLRRFFDKRMTMAIALRCGSKDPWPELRIIARKSMTRPVGEGITVAAALGQNTVKQRRGGHAGVPAQGPPA